MSENHPHRQSGLSNSRAADEPEQVQGETVKLVPDPGAEKPSAANSANSDLAIGELIAQLTCGTLIDEKYRVQEPLGRGGMGIVFAARHEALNRDVALKFLYTPDQEQEGLRERFRREAQINAKLKNEHITRVLDVGIWRGASYIVMERLEGRDLRKELLDAGGVFPIETAVEYALQLCEGIAEAHGHGIVHRDLKPSNLFVTQGPDGAPLLKIMDFGISKWDAEPDDLTKSGTVLGSPKYMAPEQIFGADVFGLRGVDARADVWSIAVICYEMLSGRPPYKEATLPRFCAELMSGPPPPLASVAQQPVPPALSDLLATCFERNPALRPQSVAEFAGALQEAVGASGNSVREKLRAIISLRPRISRSRSGITLASSAPVPTALGPLLAPNNAVETPSTGVTNISPMLMASSPRRKARSAVAVGLFAVSGVALVGVVGLVGWRSVSGPKSPTSATSAPAAPTPEPPVEYRDPAAVNLPPLVPQHDPITAPSAVILPSGPVRNVPRPPPPRKAATKPSGLAAVPAAASSNPKVDDDTPTMR